MQYCKALNPKYLYIYVYLSQVVDNTKNIAEIPEWFSGSRLNYAENLLRYKDNKTAIIECGMCSLVSSPLCICIVFR